MDENKDFYDLNFDEKFEDIVSDSKMKGGKREYEDISSFSEKAKKSANSEGWWKRMTKGKKAALISVLSIFLTIVILLGYLFIRFDYNYDKYFNVETEPIDKNIVNVALFGVDCRDENDFTGLTDSIMILSINKKTNKIKIISVMRDTFVPILDENKEIKKHGKINSAYASGGSDVTKSATMAVNTLNYVYNLDIANYAVVNFYGMIDIIDAVGGITATITEDELAWKGSDHPNLNNCMDEICREKGLNANNYYIKKAGEQTLNGVQAVAYARVRHCRSVWGTNNDYGRTDRQRHVMQGLFNKAITMDKDKYVALYDSLKDCSQTSLSRGNILDLAISVLLQNPSFEQYRLPPEGYITQMLMTSPTGYGSVVYYDIDYAARMVNAIIYDDITIEEFVESNPIERNYWFGGSGPSNSGTTTPPPANTDNNIPDDNDTTLDDGTTEDDEIIEDDGGSVIDGIVDGIIGSDDKDTDIDGDGIPNEEDTDDDGDGIPDDEETEEPIDPPQTDGEPTDPDDGPTDGGTTEGENTVPDENTTPVMPESPPQTGH